MRLDKYLKTARILKRRTVSKELADQHRVYVNGRVAKPSTDVNPGDEIRVIFGYRELCVRVPADTEAGVQERRRTDVRSAGRKTDRTGKAGNRASMKSASIDAPGCD